MDQGSESKTSRKTWWDFAVLGVGFAGGILASLLVFVSRQAPEALKDHPLLSWPFLGFVLAIVLLMVFHRAISGALSRGNISLTWGDKTISIQEIGENFDKELESRLGDLESELEDVRNQLKVLGSGETAPTDAGSVGADVLSRIESAFGLKDRDLSSIVFHLGTSKYEWRNIATLAKRTGLSSPRIDELARGVPQLIIRGSGKTGNTIFRLTEAARRDFGAIVGQSS